MFQYVSMLDSWSMLILSEPENQLQCWTVPVSKYLLPQTEMPQVISRGWACAEIPTDLGLTLTMDDMSATPNSWVPMVLHEVYCDIVRILMVGRLIFFSRPFHSLWLFQDELDSMAAALVAAAILIQPRIRKPDPRRQQWFKMKNREIIGNK